MGLHASTTALVNGQAIDHAVQLSRDEPSLAIGMHFVLTMGKPLTAMPGLTRDGVLGKWIWQLTKEDALPLESTQEGLSVSICVSLSYLDANRILIAIIMCICSADFPDCCQVCGRAGHCVAGRIVRWRLILTVNLRAQGFSSAFYGEISESLFLQVLDDAGHRGDRSLEVMCHPAFIDNTIRQSAYCFPRLTELDVLTSASLKRCYRSAWLSVGKLSGCVSEDVCQMRREPLHPAINSYKGGVTAPLETADKRKTA